MGADTNPTARELEQQVKAPGCVEFPKSEAFPQTVEEALAMGWERTDVDSTFSEDLREEVGTVRYDKEFDAVGGIHVKFPFRALYTFGRACVFGNPPDRSRKI